MSETGMPATDAPQTPHRKWYRLALTITIVLVVGVVVMLPLAVRSMQEVLGRSSDPLYDLMTGEVLTAAAAKDAEAHVTYFNLGLVGFDQNGQVTVAVSGNRACTPNCPTLDIVFSALDDDADQRRGLPPSASLTLTPDDRFFSQAIQLPVRGQPSLYPFDQYQLWLGIGGEEIHADGTTTALRPEAVVGHAVVTFQNRIPDFIMSAPVPVAPESVNAAADPFTFLAVRALTFERPAYLKVLAVVLVILIAISATLALLTRGIDELALGFGGIILGVWGVRSILMPQGVATVTAIDLALSWLILLLLLGLAVRAALHFHRHSDLPLPRLR